MKVIKTKSEYEAALASIDKLIALDPDAGTTAAEDLEMLSLIIRDYEARMFPSAMPDPVEAILFRMEQEGLTPRDLIPILGSRSKVSEVLSRKRGLSLSMLQALHEKLRIPAEILLKGQSRTSALDSEEDLLRLPITDMVSRGWLPLPVDSKPSDLQSAIRTFLSPLRETESPLNVLFRKTRHVRSERQLDPYALMAWTAQVLHVARTEQHSTPYVAANLTPDVLNGLAKLSVFDEGPRLAREYLRRYGIALVFVEHLPRTRLDGAVFLMDGDQAVIGLTLRHDRVDNFWFTLFHELGHLTRDLSFDHAGFVDDLDSEAGDDPREVGADSFARDTLIPSQAWENSPARNATNPTYARTLASQLGIHPAIVAGRIQYEVGSYRVLRQLLGHGEVRKALGIGMEAK